MSTFNYISMGEYLPKRYSANYAQQQMRQEVYDFKDGRAGYTVYEKFIRGIKNIFSICGSDVRGKKVKLIDNFITRGTTFTQTARLLIDAGAKVVTGLFLAKTVNPDWRA